MCHAAFSSSLLNPFSLTFTQQQQVLTLFFLFFFSFFTSPIIPSHMLWHGFQFQGHFGLCFVSTHSHQNQVTLNSFFFLLISSNQFLLAAFLVHLRLLYVLFFFCRCELLVFSGGSHQKIASGLFEPFVSHLKFLRDEISKGGYSIKLLPPSNSAFWFTRATFERWLLLLSTFTLSFLAS